jgi:hypothetical protein
MLLRGYFRLLGDDLRFSSILEVGPTALPSRDPTLGYDRYVLVGLLWGLALCLVELLWLLVWAALRGAHAIPHGAFLPGFVFLAGFSFTGMLDAIWRMWLMWWAKQKKYRGGGQADGATIRLMRLADANSGTLVLQVIVGVALTLATF